MALLYGFYNSQNRDRVYNAEDFGRYLDGIITDGVLPAYGNQFKIFSDPGNFIGVWFDTGKAWFKSTWTLNDDSYWLGAPAANPTYDRLDQVVLEINKTTRTNRVYIAAGTPSANPLNSRATVSSSGSVYRYVLGYFYVRFGAVKVQPNDVFPLVGLSREGITGAPHSKFVVPPDDLTSLDGRLNAVEKRVNTVNEYTSADGISTATGFSEYGNSIRMKVNPYSVSMFGTLNVTTAPTGGNTNDIPLLSFANKPRVAISSIIDGVYGSFQTASGVTGLVRMNSVGAFLTYRGGNPPVGYLKFTATATL